MPYNREISVQDLDSGWKKIQKRKIKLRCDGKIKNLKSILKGTFSFTIPLGIGFFLAALKKKVFFRCHWKTDKDGLESRQGQMSPFIPSTSKLLF